MGPKKRKRTEEQKAKEAARSKRRRMEELARKREAQELAEGLKGEIRRLEDQLEESSRKEEEWLRERESMVIKLGEIEMELMREKFLWGVRFDEGSGFGEEERKKIALALHKAAMVGVEKSKEGESSSNTNSFSSDNGNQWRRDRMMMEKIAACLSIDTSTLEAWVEEEFSQVGMIGGGYQAMWGENDIRRGEEVSGQFHEGSISTFGASKALQPLCVEKEGSLNRIYAGSS